jgi:SAM-dependent methyltransferase
MALEAQPTRTPDVDYDAIAPSYAADRGASPVVIEELVRGLSRAKIGSLLEMGCGTGDYLAALAGRLGARGFGMDRSLGMLTEGRRKNPGPWVVRADAQRGYPFRDASFDACMSVNVMHYLTDLGGFFAEAYRVTKPGAVAVTVTDSEEDLRRRTQCRYFPETLDVELKRYPPISAIRAAIEQTGWVEVQCTHTERTFPLDRAMLQRFRNKARSSLRLISPAGFQAGMTRLERDLSTGNVLMTESYTYVWARKP